MKVPCVRPDQRSQVDRVVAGSEQQGGGRYSGHPDDRMDTLTHRGWKHARGRERADST
jgi:hypothetical protein